jgi:hypothetical protein
VTTSRRVFAGNLYPLRALESASAAFGEVCPTHLEEVPEGTRVTFDLPEGADVDLVGEFSNIALVAAIEIHLARTP